MTSIVGVTTSATAHWNRFWFEPQATSSLALFRIAFGAVAACWTVSLLPNLMSFYGPRGVLPSPPERQPYEWGILFWFPQPPVVVAVVAVTLLASLAVSVGACTRTASVLLALGMMCIEQRNVAVTNGGDSLLRDLAFLLVLTPAGTALSVDRLRSARDRFWDAPSRSPWGLRLIQLQISVGYLASVWHKSGGELWRNEEAVWYALRIEDIHRFPTPAFIADSVVITSALTVTTLVLEFALGVLVWNRLLRPWVLLSGVALHLGIESSIMVGFFGLAIMAGYLAFLPPEVSSRFVQSGRRLVKRLGRFSPAGS